MRRVVRVTVLLLGGSAAWAGPPRIVAPGEISSLAGDWRARTGDDPAWASPDLDDSSWVTLRQPRGWGPEARLPASTMAWHRLELRIAGAPATAEGRAALRLGVTLGKVDSAYELFAGGIRVGGSGTMPPEPRINYDQHRTYVLPPQAIAADGRLVLALRGWKAPATNTSIPGPLEGPFLIGPVEDLVRRELFSELPELVLAALFLITGVLHLNLYRRRPQLREYFWFAMVAFNTAAYTIFRTQWKFSISEDFMLLKSLEHGLLYFQVVCFVQFLWPLMGWPMRPWVRGYQWIGLACGALVMLTPGMGLKLRLLPFWQASVLALTAILLAGLVRDIVRGHPEGRTIGIGIALLAAAYLNDAALDRGFIVSPRLIPFGFFAFVWSMAISLSNRFTRVHDDMDALRKDLERRVEERTRELAEANRAKSQFLANMSHEIRTPMNGVIGMTRLLLETRLAPEQRDYAETIQGSGRSLLSIINNILDFSKIEAGRLELDVADFDLTLLAEETLKLLSEAAARKGLALALDVAPETPRFVRGDAGRLRQTLTNLVGNALKFTDSGEVRVTLKREAESAARTLVRFEVRDSGAGIRPADQERLFRPFSQADGSTTRRFGGTGLGLAISKSLVELMGGHIGLESQPGRGSLFWFTVALERQGEVRPAASPAAAPALAGSVPGSRGRVLVAEDNPVNQRVAVGYLEGLGYAVDVVGSGSAAVEARFAARYDAVLMDCQMPGMDGYEATRQIRDREGGAGHTPIIAMTASAMKGDREKCLAAGMDDYVSKPMTPEELRAALQRWTSAPAVSQPVPPLEHDALRAILASTTPSFVVEIIDLFLRDTPKRLDALSTAARAGDGAGMDRVAHGLRGSAAMIGATELAGLCSRVAALVEEGRIGEAASVADQLVEAYTGAREALEAERRRFVAAADALPPSGSSSGA